MTCFLAKGLVLFNCFCGCLFLHGNDTPIIGVYSGSFDPPTTAHYKIILAAIEKQKFDKFVIYVNQYGKKPYRATPADRKRMVELLLEDISDVISVVIQGNADKRIDYRNIRQPGYRLALVIGEDSYFKRLELPEIQKIPVDKIFVVPRASEFTALQQALGPEAQIMYVPDIDNISSTKVCQELKAGNFSKIDTDKMVLKYILENRLYL